MNTTVSESSPGLLRRVFLPEDPFHRTILGLALGIFCGLFLGEIAGGLQVVGQLYIKLLQMTVLPYVMAAVILGIGRLDSSSAGTLGLRAVALIGLIWLVSWLTSFTVPLAYPEWETGSFFAGPLPSEGPPNLLDLFVPSNIFESLTFAVVPAVVVFSVAFGLALMTMDDKDVVLGGLGVIEKALGRIMGFVVKFAPIGVFAMSANAAGTIQVEELSRLQIYLWTYGVACFLLAFVTLPLLVSMATPLSYLDVIRQARNAMLTAFAVGTVLVVIPLIAERCKELLQQSGFGEPDADSAVDILAPTAYVLPSAGTPVSLAFILFAGWFIGQPIGLLQYPEFAALSVPSSFGGMVLALPFLLDYFRLPADLFNLFVLGGILTNNIFTATAAMHGVVVCLLGACSVTGRLAWSRVLPAAASGIVLAAVVFFAMGLAFQGIVPEENLGEKRLRTMQLTQERVATSEPARSVPLSAEERDRERLAVVRDRGTLRVGILDDRLPFVFRSESGEAIGLDMELMHALAADLGVELELFDVDWGQAVEWLDTGRVDLVVGGIAITTRRALGASFTRSYVEETPGFLVRDPERDKFESVEGVRQLPSLTLGIMPYYFQNQIQQALPDARLKVIESPLPFLKGERTDIDAVLFAAEMGSAWTLIYPHFTVVLPEGLDVRVPVGFAVPASQPAYVSFIDNWLNVNVKIGKVERLYQHWVLGKSSEESRPRWSIIRDVLHWID